MYKPKSRSGLNKSRHIPPLFCSCWVQRQMNFALVWHALVHVNSSCGALRNALCGSQAWKRERPKKREGISCSPVFYSARENGWKSFSFISLLLSLWVLSRKLFSFLSITTVVTVFTVILLPRDQQMMQFEAHVMKLKTCVFMLQVIVGVFNIQPTHLVIGVAQTEAWTCWECSDSDERKLDTQGFTESVTLSFEQLKHLHSFGLFLNSVTSEESCDWTVTSGLKLCSLFTLIRPVPSLPLAALHRSQTTWETVGLIFDLIDLCHSFIYVFQIMFLIILDRGNADSMRLDL